LTLGNAAAGPPQRASGRRLRRDERERLIVKEAIAFFADAGFTGDTRELARCLGVTQPLLYRYFPTKEALVERVCDEVFVGRWDPRWEQMIADRSVPLRTRLEVFYKAYARIILDREWLRIFMFAGLKGAGLNERFLAILRDRTLRLIGRELRCEFALPSPEELPLSEQELELVWAINGRIVYLGIRRWIYGTQVPEDLDAVIENTIGVFFEGVEVVMDRIIDAQCTRRSNQEKSVPRPLRASETPIT
jgi:AcrR family transcriptional regulator